MAWRDLREGSAVHRVAVELTISAPSSPSAGVLPLCSLSTSANNTRYEGRAGFLQLPFSACRLTLHAVTYRIIRARTQLSFAALFRPGLFP
jgi:hypothetical protein